MKVITLYIALILISSVNLMSWDRYIIEVDDYQLLHTSRQIMMNQVGLVEKTGKNDGAHITLYMNSCYLSGKKQYAYCAAGQSWCLSRAAIILQLPYPFSKHSAVANFYYEDAVAIGVLDTISAVSIDDLIIWKHRTGRTGHIERIISTDKGIFTVGFNTSNGKTGSQREGNGIFIRKRNLNSPLGRMRLRGLVGFNRKF
jgi:hypothetical protein